MNETTIEYPAKYIVFWPGQEVYACENHMLQLQELDRVMGGGGHVPFRIESGICLNCVNEAKKKDLPPKSP